MHSLVQKSDKFAASASSELCKRHQKSSKAPTLPPPSPSYTLIFSSFSHTVGHNLSYCLTAYTVPFLHSLFFSSSLTRASDKKPLKVQKHPRCRQPSVCCHLSSCLTAYYHRALFVLSFSLPLSHTVGRTSARQKQPKVPTSTADAINH